MVTAVCLKLLRGTFTFLLIKAVFGPAPPVGRALLFWPSVKERCFDSGGGEVIGSDDATEPLRDGEMISNVMFREETGARERWDGFSATTGSFSGVGTFPSQFVGTEPGNTEHLFFTWTECLQKRSANIYPSDGLQLLKSVNKLIHVWVWRSLEERTTRSFCLPDYRKLNSGFIGASPRLLLICSCVVFRQQIVLLHLLFSFCLQLHLPHLSPDIPTISPPHISISPLSLCLTWA